MSFPVSKLRSSTEVRSKSFYGTPFTTTFSRLFRFANGTQRKFLDLYFLHFEIDVMKRCLRDAVSGKRSELNFKSFEPFFRKHSHLDFTALTDSKDLDEYLDSIQNTPYYGPLKD